MASAFSRLVALAPLAAESGPKGPPDRTFILQTIPVPDYVARSYEMGFQSLEILEAYRQTRFPTAFKLLMVILGAEITQGSM